MWTLIFLGAEAYANAHRRSMIFMEIARKKKWGPGRRVICAFFCAIAVACSSYLSTQSKVHVNDFVANVANVANGANGLKSYKEAIAKIDAERAALALEHQRANTQAKKNEVIGRARKVITQSIVNDLFPFWYGTDWDFNGVTETPNQGRIACGYFVSTLLRDAGWKVERARLAQQASENIVLSLTAEPHVKRFRRVAIGDFAKAVKEWGEGLYVVGLDIHTGFIVNSGGEVYFVHSSYVDPYKVVKERAVESRILSSSNYRVIGKLSADDRLVTKWLFKSAIPTRTK
jgi:hypothetical protein